MVYLSQIKEKINNNDYPGFLKIWEEYCYNESVNYEELKNILLELRNSDLLLPFGQHVNRAIFLWEKLQDPEEKHDILKLIIEIQTRNDEDLAEIAYQHLKNRYPEDPLFNEKIKLIGLKAKKNFQDAIAKYELLNHIKKGKFVFHTAGWGTGEVLDVSFLREEMVLEFEYVIGSKNLAFENALKTLKPLPDTHFLSRRFGNPDLLEKQAKEKPIEVIKMILQDLGPLNATEIKDHFFDLVIPSEDWNKWWQKVRLKLKKDKKIVVPENINDPFTLRKKEISHEEIFQKSFENKLKPKEIIQLVYNFLKDFPESLKNQEFKNALILKLADILSFEELTPAKKIQIYFFLETLKADKNIIKINELVSSATSINSLLEEIDIIHFKKRLLMAIKKYRKDWEMIFLELFFSLNQNILRDYILSELQKAKSSKIKPKIQELLEHPLLYPNIFVWYFLKIISDKQKEYDFSDFKGKSKFFEGFLILLDHLENKSEYRDLAKKMIHLLIDNKYQLIREIFEKSSFEQVKEYLLLVTKCRLLDSHDISVIHSLGKAIHSNLNDYTQKEEKENCWITAKGYEDLKKKITKISNVDMLDNAKEIEEARAHGDLRENAEYKAALERRSRLQGELKFLSELLGSAQILTKDAVSMDRVSVGSIVNCQNEKNEKITFTILGSFEADIDKNILSNQSNFAKKMLGKKPGDTFSFNEENYTILSITNYFD